MIFCALSCNFSNFCVIISDIFRTGVEQYSYCWQYMYTCTLYTVFAANIDIDFLILARSLIRAMAFLSTFLNGHSCSGKDLGAFQDIYTWMYSLSGYLATILSNHHVSKAS